MTIHVSPAGSDTNMGTQPSPVQTIQRGIELANRANTIGIDAVVLIGPGIYREAVVIGPLSTNNGQVRRRDAGEAALTLEGAGAGTILTGADNWSTGWTRQLRRPLHAPMAEQVGDEGDPGGVGTLLGSRRESRQARAAPPIRDDLRQRRWPPWRVDAV